MRERISARLYALARRLRRLERRELESVVRWLERTGNLLHLSVLVLVPSLVAAITWLSNVSAVVSFLLFPPLASGTYTLFADPEGRYSTPGTFVGGMTVGALCGWFALEVAAAVGLPGGPISAAAAGLGVFATGLATWALDLETPTAFSSALLVLVTGDARFAYVLGIVVSSSVVALAFVAWRDHVYARRARYLYRTTGGDDHVLVPVGPTEGTAAETDPETVARFAAELASAHDAGRVVLLDGIEEDATERPSGTDGDDERTPPPEANRETARTVDALESLAGDLEAEYDVPCEVVVAAGDGPSLSASLVLRTARENNCDLVVTPYAEREGGGLSAFVGRLFEGEIDVVAFRSADGRSRWRHGLVAVRGAGDTARAMVDFALRLSGTDRPVSVLTCIDRESNRRRAEATVADLVDAFDGRFETHVVTASIRRHLSRVAPRYDVVFVGSSTDRSTASRFVSPPTFEKLGDLDADVAIVHRGRRR